MAGKGLIVDLARWAPPTRVINLPDGDSRLERLPSMRHAIMLGRSGHVVRVVLRNGMGNNAFENDPYGVQILAEKQRKGMVRWDRCLTVHPYPEHLPEDLRGRPQCRKGADGGPLNGDNPCSCMLELQKRRRAIHEKKARETEARYTPAKDREHSMLGGAVEALTKLVENQSKSGKVKRDD